MKTWAVVLMALTINGNQSIHLIFIDAFDLEEAQSKALRACDIVYPESKGYKGHKVGVRDTQVMYDEASFVKEWDYA
jgi:hypothetical protein